MNYDLERRFWEAVNRFDSDKVKIIRVSISSAFMARARCKFCKGTPVYYYGCYKQHMFEQVQRYRLFTPRNWRWIKRMCSSWYKEYEPRTFDDTFEFTFRLDYKNYRPTLHRARGAECGQRENILECVCCECSRTVWVFNQESTKRRKEITNRKGKYAYPQKFER